MRIGWAIVLLTALSLCRGEETPTPSTSPQPSTPLPAAQDIATSNAYKNLEKQINKGVSLPSVPSYDLLNPSDPTLPLKQLKEDQARDKDNEDEKNDSNKNWLLNSIFDIQKTDRAGTNQDNFDKFRAEAMKSLTKPDGKGDPAKEDLVDGKKSLVKTVQSQEASREADKDPNTPTNPFAFSGGNLQTWQPSTSVAGEMTSFKPAISGLSLDSTKSLSDEAEKAYKQSIASIKPIQSFEIPSTPVASVQSPVTDFNPILPIDNQASIFRTNNSGITPPAQLTFPSPNSPVMDVTIVTPIVPPAPIKPVTPSTPPSASTSAYKPKVADPNDYLNH